MKFDLITFLLEQIIASVHHANSHAGNVQEVQQEQPQCRLKLGIDASLIGYKYVHDRSSLEADGAIICIATALSAGFIDVIIVLDGDKHHPLKRASCEHKGEMEKASIGVIVARTQLQSLLNDHDNTSEDAKRVHDLQKKIWGLKNYLKRWLPSNFNQSLKDFVNGYDSEGKGDILIQTAPWQANPCLVQLAVEGGIDAIISGDSNFCVYIGPGQSALADIMLKDLQVSTTGTSGRRCVLLC